MCPACTTAPAAYTLDTAEGRHALRRGRRSARWSIPTIRRTSQQVHALQDAIKVSQESAGTFEVPELGSGQPEEGARCAAGARRPRCPISRRLSAPRREVDPVRHLIGTAAAWGGNPDKDATYLNVTPAEERRQDGLQARRQGRAGRRLLVGQRLQREGLLREEPYNAYSLNNITAKKEADGSIAIQFGGCDGKIAELPADHAGLELHGAALSPASRRS